MSRRHVAKVFINSAAHRQAEVAAYSQEFLGQPNAPGANRLVHALRSGVSEEKVVRRILNTPAYHSAQADPALLARDLYIEVLGQAPTSADAAALQGRLSSPKGWRRAVDQLVHSAALDTQIVDSFYAAYLHRQPGAAELARWTAVLRSPRGSAGDVAVGILASAEFYRQAQGR